MHLFMSDPGYCGPLFFIDTLVDAEVFCDFA